LTNADTAEAASILSINRKKNYSSRRDKKRGLGRERERETEKRRKESDIAKF